MELCARPRGRYAGCMGKGMSKVCRALADRIRLEVLRSVARGAKSEDEIAADLGLVAYELERPLLRIQEAGVLSLGDDGQWGLGRGITAKPDGEYVNVRFDIPGEAVMELGLVPPRRD